MTEIQTHTFVLFVWLTGILMKIGRLYGHQVANGIFLGCFVFKRFGLNISFTYKCNCMLHLEKGFSNLKHTKYIQWKQDTNTSLNSAVSGTQ